VDVGRGGGAGVGGLGGGCATGKFVAPVRVMVGCAESLAGVLQ